MLDIGKNCLFELECEQHHLQPGQQAANSVGSAAWPQLQCLADQPPSSGHLCPVADSAELWRLLELPQHLHSLEY